ncbi:MAG: DUF1013 domain-containing protein [Alphaproteobacteria bacterium]|nr:DUF1013 domain-containing protein [Alphaproteobacteria bacterium]
MAKPLMPKATAMWLVEETALTFDQIAEFCGLHPLEIQGIADGEVAPGIIGRDPITAGELTRDELERCEKDPAARLSMVEPEIELKTRPPGPRYTPVAKRQNRPDAIAWLIKYHPELTDAQICHLVGTTKPTVVSVRERSHWNIQNLKPQDPVSLGICSQVDLDEAIQTADRRLRRKEDRERRAAARAQREKTKGEQPASDAVTPAAAEPEPTPAKPATATILAPAPAPAPTTAPLSEIERVFGTPAPKPTE